MVFCIFSDAFIFEKLEISPTYSKKYNMLYFQSYIDYKDTEIDLQWIGIFTSQKEKENMKFHLERYTLDFDYFQSISNPLTFKELETDSISSRNEHKLVLQYRLSNLSASDSGIYRIKASYEDFVYTSDNTALEIYGKSFSSFTFQKKSHHLVSKEYFLVVRDGSGTFI